MQKITTFLMFNEGAEDAAKLYTSIFKSSKITSVGRGPDGKASSVNFELDGTPYYAFNGGPHFKFSEGMSLFVHCDTQAEVDELWEKLSEGGNKSHCGWLQDRWGVSWQIVPKVFLQYMGDKDPQKVGRVVQAMLKMGKFDIAALKRAYDGD